MQEHTQQPTGASEREELLRELVIRLAMYPGDPRTKDPQLLVGELPNLPEQLPMPEGSCILGTLIRGPEYATIVLDAPQPPQSVLDFYKEQLRVTGWQEPETFMSPYRSGGFAHTGFRFDKMITFHRSPHGPSPLSLPMLEVKPPVIYVWNSISLFSKK